MNKTWLLLAAGTSVFLGGCHLDMYIQPKVKSQSENLMFADGKGTRLPVPNTIEFGKPRLDSEFYTGYSADGKLLREMPIQIDEAVMRRGKERFDIYCSHCHGAAGDGDGMIAKRGFTLARPVGNYHTDRLREMPVGHFFDVISNGYGTMYGHASRISPTDRWAIVAYVRALQLSQGAKPEDLDADAMKALDMNGAPGTGPLFVPKVGAPTTVLNPGPVDGVTTPQLTTPDTEGGE